jgi:putative redox protein
MLVTARSKKNYQVQITTGRHTFTVDEPAGIGDDTGPDPYALLLSSLASCTIITLHMYANRKKWPLERVTVSMNTYRTHVKDCEECEGDPDSRISIIESDINLFGELSTDQKERLLEISKRCPVHRTLTGLISIRTRLVEEQV